MGSNAYYFLLHFQQMQTITIVTITPTITPIARIITGEEPDSIDYCFKSM